MPVPALFDLFERPGQILDGGLLVILPADGHCRSVWVLFRCSPLTAAPLGETDVVAERPG